LILYIWHPQFESALEILPHDLSCYHIDDDYSFSEVGDTSDAEQRLIANARQVFVISPGLLERKGQNPNTTLIPEGVDFDAYSTPVDEPVDIRDIPRPRIGYTGVLKKQLDWPLLLELSRRLDWSLVFVGPTNHQSEIGQSLAELKKQRNVYFLGAKTTRQLAAYPQHFDVCIMPYRVDGYTNQIYPLKLHEYLASGRPIVASPIRSLMDFSNLIRLESTVEGWINALAASLLPTANTSAAVAERQRAAQQHDWTKLVERIADKMCEGLARALSSRLEPIFKTESNQIFGQNTIRIRNIRGKR
jgi:glycosyltransferase involved in cell wall biosynthesis